MATDSTTALNCVCRCPARMKSFCWAACCIFWRRAIDRVSISNSASIPCSFKQGYNHPLPQRLAFVAEFVLLTATTSQAGLAGRGQVFGSYSLPPCVIGDDGFVESALSSTATATLVPTTALDNPSSLKLSCNLSPNSSSFWVWLASRCRHPLLERWYFTQCPSPPGCFSGTSQWPCFSLNSFSSLSRDSHDLTTTVYRKIGSFQYRDSMFLDSFIWVMLSRFGDIWIGCTYIYTSDWSGSCSEEGPLFAGSPSRPL